MTSTLLFSPVTVKLCCQGITPVPLRSLFEYRDGTRLVFEEDDKEQLEQLALALFEPLKQQIAQQFGLAETAVDPGQSMEIHKEPTAKASLGGPKPCRRLFRQGDFFR